MKEEMGQYRETAADAMEKTLFQDNSSSTGAVPGHGKGAPVTSKPRLPTFSGESKDSSFAHSQYEVKLLLMVPYD